MEQESLRIFSATLLNRGPCWAFELLIPWFLVTIRAIIGLIILTLSLSGVRGLIYFPLLVAGTLSDIFDGIIARRYKSDTPALRRADSLVDLLYYLLVLSSALIVNMQPFKSTAIWFAILIASELGCVLFSLIKFYKLPATHSYLAKIYGLTLVVGFLAILAFESGNTGWVLLFVITGLIANLEVLIILLLSRSPPVDMKSLFSIRRDR